MKFVMCSLCLACAGSMVAVSAVAAEPTMSLKDILSQRVGPVAYDRTDYRRLLEKVSVEIHTPIVIDDPALRLDGYAPGQSIRIREPAQTADKLLAASLKSISRESRFCFTASTDKFGRVELLFTTLRQAKAQGLLVVPLEIVADPKSVRVSVEFEKNTLENGLLVICMQLGAGLRLDDAGLAEAEIPVTRQFAVKIEGRPASSALDEMFRRFDPTGSIAYLFAQNSELQLVLVVGTKERLKDFGPFPDLKNFDDIAERSPPGPNQVWMLRSPLRWVSDALAKPIEGEARSLSLSEALEAISRETRLPIEIAVVDLEFAGISRSQSVTFDPRRREARAVLYDVLWQSDPRKEGTLVACIERRKDDAYVLVVTTRQAANSAGRSLLTDYNLSPDDIQAR